LGLSGESYGASEGNDDTLWQYSEASNLPYSSILAAIADRGQNSFSALRNAPIFSVHEAEETPSMFEPKQPTYKITRFRFDGDHRVIRRGLTLEEAQAHCQSPKTRGEGWFDGYGEERPKKRRR
jgi:hypothetical protein